jgi:5'-nucleotidase
VYSDTLRPMEDPWGRRIYWVGGGSMEWIGQHDSDFRAVEEGWISVTPLHLDLTHHAVIDASETWWQDL